MACEDFPCCGHESGCCPDFDESGKQLNMKCVCGATLPVDARYSLCSSCLTAPDPDDPDSYDDRFDGEDVGIFDDDDVGLHDEGY